jgi:alanine racemase
MINRLKKIIKPKYETLNKIKIKRSAIVHNFKILQKEQPQAVIFPVLKSNAYGHGLKEICEILNDTEAPMVALDSFPEAQVAYKYFKKRILILGEMLSDAYSYCKLNRTDFCVYNSDSLKALAKLGRARIHLFVNSGMNREGIQDLTAFLLENKQLLKKVKVVGLCSHLSSAENATGLQNKKQLNLFLKNLDILAANGYYPEYVHLGNSAAIFTLHDKRLNAFRSGLALYGYNPLNSYDEAYQAASALKPALTLTSTIVSLQSLEVGDPVSYNESYRAQSATKIAVIPFGYYEGLNRELSNKAKFIWQKNGEQFLLPVAGKVCMNLCCLEANGFSVKIGDKVEVISSNPQAENSVVNLAKLSGQIPYDFLVKIQANIRREIV